MENLSDNERLRFSKTIFDQVELLLNNTPYFLHNEDGLLVEIQERTEGDSVSRAYVKIERIIAQRSSPEAPTYLLESISFRIQLSHTFDQQGLVSAYLKDSFWIDEDGEEIEEDDEEPENIENYEDMLAVERMTHQIEEQNAVFDTASEFEILELLYQV